MIYDLYIHFTLYFRPLTHRHISPTTSSSSLQLQQLTTGRLTCLHWLPVHSRITFKIACLTYKTLATGQPAYLRVLLNQYVPSRQLRSSSQYLLEQQPVKTEFGKRSFSYMSPYIWNSLPYDVKLSQSYDTFKRRLKTHLTRC